MFKKNKYKDQLNRFTELLNENMLPKKEYHFIYDNKNNNISDLIIGLEDELNFYGHVKKSNIFGDSLEPWLKAAVYVSDITHCLNDYFEIITYPQKEEQIPLFLKAIDKLNLSKELINNIEYEKKVVNYTNLLSKILDLKKDNKNNIDEINEKEENRELTNAIINLKKDMEKYINKNNELKSILIYNKSDVNIPTRIGLAIETSNYSLYRNYSIAKETLTVFNKLYENNDFYFTQVKNALNELDQINEIIKNSNENNPLYSLLYDYLNKSYTKIKEITLDAKTLRFSYTTPSSATYKENNELLKRMIKGKNYEIYTRIMQLISYDSFNDLEKEYDFNLKYNQKDGLSEITDFLRKKRVLKNNESLSKKPYEIVEFVKISERI